MSCKIEAAVISLYGNFTPRIIVITNNVIIGFITNCEDITLQVLCIPIELSVMDYADGRIVVIIEGNKDVFSLKGNYVTAKLENR